MKVLVLSDTHGKTNLALLVQLASSCDLVVHLGDGYHEGELLSAIQSTPVIQVTGNTDYPLVVIPEKMVTLEERSMLLTHGHLFACKTGYGGLVARAKEYGVSTVLFGHTHQPEFLNQDGIILFNPGSARISSENKKPTAGLLVIEGDAFEASWIDLEAEKTLS